MSDRRILRCRLGLLDRRPGEINETLYADEVTSAVSGLQHDEAVVEEDACYVDDRAIQGGALEFGIRRLNGPLDFEPPLERQLRRLISRLRREVVRGKKQ